MCWASGGLANEGRAIRSEAYHSREEGMTEPEKEA